MKKLLTLAAMATLLTAGSAFAQWGRHAVAQPNATFAFAAGSGLAPGPSTTNNDDSCDIGVTPAATLLLPYFEVETAARAVDTFFTITNTSRVPQIAHVTVWTDWSFPVLDFNIFLTGYDVQPLSMYDIIVNGSIAPTATGGIGGTSSSTSKGSLSLNNLGGNPNFFGWVAAPAPGTSTIGCTGLPGAIPPGIRSAVQSALVTGIYNATGFASSCGTVNSVGSPASDHATPTTAVGYVTVDVANRCSTTLPTDPAYYNSEMLYDNTLIGDYQILNKAAGSNYAGGNPLVHIRAIPEGGPAGSVPGGVTPTNLPWTFYSRYNTGVAATVVPNPAFMDRRQPLPSVFAARWIQGGANAFNTSYRIWREGVTGAGVNTAVGIIPTDCLDVYLNGAIPIAEIVRFDEHEDFNTYSPGVIISPNVPSGVTLPESSTTSTANGTFPPATFTGLGANDVGGWMYLNLNSVSGAGTATSGTATGVVNVVPAGTGPYATTVRPSQNWVVVSMNGAGSTAGLFGVDFDAAWLGNGCSAPVGLSNANSGTFNIGPVGGTPVCPASTAGCTPLSTTYPGTNVTP